MDPALSTKKEKKIKLNTSIEGVSTQNPNQKQQQDYSQWRTVALQKPLFVSIFDHSKVNKFYSHRSIQNEYMPKSNVATNQKAIAKIEGRLFQKMLLENQLPFIKKLDQPDTKAIFRKNQIVKQGLWDSLFCYDQQLAKEQKLPIMRRQSQPQQQLNQQLFNTFKSYKLTPNQMRNNLYPVIGLPLYSNYLQLDPASNVSVPLCDKILCVDCEMVSTQKGFQLARTTICNFNGKILLDQFYKPNSQITNYNTQYSGITKQILDPITNTIQQHLHPKLKSIITTETILIGHSLENDLHAMKFIHHNVIDTSVVFRRKNGTKMKLKNLSQKILNRKIQIDTHDSIEDCLATLDLIKAKIHSDLKTDKQQQQIEYHLVKQLCSQRQKLCLIIDHDVQELKKYNHNIKVQKVQQQMPSSQRFQIMCKYLDQQNCKILFTDQYSGKIPQIILMRIIKSQSNKQCGLQSLVQKSQPGTLLLFNFQLNQSVQIIFEGQMEYIDRPFCFISVKN